MARSHARILTTIWADPDFRALSVEGQRLYLLLLSQGSLNNAGVLPMTTKRWAAGCDDTDTCAVEKALAELDDARFVVVDAETEEVLIRSFIRNDGIVKQPQMMKNALREALSVESPRLRAVLACELRKLRREDASFTADQIDPADPEPDPDPADRSPVQSQGSLLEGFDQADGSPAEASAKGAELRRGRGRGSSSSLVRSTSVGGRAKRAHRIPEDFTVTQAMVVWARKECPDVDGRYATAQFVDYWNAESGAKASKLDWVRTWQTWMRREQRDAARRGRPLRAVPSVSLPDNPADAFDDLRERADATAASRLIGVAYLPAPQPRSDDTPARAWDRAEALRFIDAHRPALLSALAEGRTG